MLGKYVIPVVNLELKTKDSLDLGIHHACLFEELFIIRKDGDIMPEKPTKINFVIKLGFWKVGKAKELAARIDLIHERMYVPDFLNVLSQQLHIKKT